MRKAPLRLFGLIAAAVLAGLWQATAQIVPDDDPTFYFTRLVYRENTNGRNRGRSRGTMAPPSRQFICPEFGGGNFFPIQGWGWGTDYPGGDCKFMGAVNRLTGIRVHPHPNVVEIMDDKLFKFPFVYAVEVGGMYLGSEEAARLREYLLRGGFLHVDDFWGPDERDNLFIQMERVFPDRQFERVPLSHPVFSTFFDIEEILQIPGQGRGCGGGLTWQDDRDREPVVYGISDDSGRLMVLVTYNSDLGDAWEYMDLPCYPAKFSGAAYRMGLNFMIYAMSH
jgi:hypothetical protein